MSLLTEILQQPVSGNRKSEVFAHLLVARFHPRGDLALPHVADARSEIGKSQAAWVDNESNKIVT